MGRRNSWLHITHSTSKVFLSIITKSSAAKGCSNVPITPDAPSTFTFSPLSLRVWMFFLAPKKSTSTSFIFSAILKFTPPCALSMLVCIATIVTSFLMAFITVRCTALPSDTCASFLKISGWCATMRLQPLATASSTIFSVTSRHNKAPETSVSVNPTCRPALSNPSCRGRGANCSRARSTSFIFTLI